MNTWHALLQHCLGLLQVTFEGRDHRPTVSHRRNYKHWDSAYLRQGTSYQCRDTESGSVIWIATKI